MSDISPRDRNWTRSAEILVGAAKRADIDPSVMIKIAGFESSFNEHARPVSRNPAANRVRQFDGTMAVSSAYGYGQFLDGTWLDMLHRYGAKYGVENAASLTRAQANAAELRGDPRLQAAMLAEFTRENIAAGARLGGPDPDANVYAFHNLGPGDATRFLRTLCTQPDLPVGQVLSREVISGNPALYGDGRRSIAEAYRAMGQLLDAFEPYVQRARHVPDRVQAPLPSRSESDRRVPSRRMEEAPHSDAHRTLHVGMQGRDVAELQTTLRQLGYHDKHGHTLQTDGDFGRRTAEALQAFQHDRGLDVSGVYERTSRTALHAAVVERVTSPTNAHHRLFVEALGKVREAERAHGVATGPHSERIAAALTVELVREGITRVDRIEFNHDSSLVRAVQVSAVRDEPGLNRSTDAISAPQASMRSIAESSRQVAEVAANVQAQRQDPQFAQARSQPVPPLAR